MNELSVNRMQRLKECYKQESAGLSWRSCLREKYQDLKRCESCACVLFTQVDMQEEIIKLKKQIQRVEASAWKEQQPKKRFELYQRMQSYKNKLVELKNE